MSELPDSLGEMWSRGARGSAAMQQAASGPLMPGMLGAIRYGSGSRGNPFGGQAARADRLDYLKPGDCAQERLDATERDRAVIDLAETRMDHAFDPRGKTMWD